MALWGKTDNLAGTPKYIARKAFFDSTAVNTTAETINLANANTGFATGDAVYYSRNDGTAISGLTDATTYFVRVVGAALIELYDTYANATASSGTTGRLNITAAGVGTHTLQHTGATNPAAGQPGIFFVDASEATVAANKAKGITGAGWWLYSTYTDVNSVVRHKAECLITMDVSAADAGDAEDTVVVDRVITISAQPANRTVVAGATAAFSVTATATGEGSLTYQWQIQQEGTGDWTDIANATAASYTTGATAIGDGAGATDGDKYRVIVSSVGVANVTSDAATLTVTAE